MSLESFRPPFSKGGADPTRGALVAPRKARNFLYGVFLLLAFLLRLFCQKKSGERSRVTLCRERGTPHLCGSPLSATPKFTLRWRFLTIRSFAACERRPTLRALDWRKPLKRLDLNFNAASRRCREELGKSQFIVQSYFLTLKNSDLSAFALNGIKG